MGAGKGGNFDKFSKFADNFADLLKKYGPLSPTGFFGEKSKDTVRHIFSSNPLETAIDFFDRLKKGALIKPLENGKGWKAEFSDGFHAVYRKTSSSDGTPVVEIYTYIKTRNASSTVEVTISEGTFKIRYQKIHFVSK